MRPIVLSMVLTVGALGLALATPAQVRADELRGPAFNGAYMPVAHHGHGYNHWRGRGYYPGYGYGYSRGYYPYSGYGVYGGLGAYPYGGYGGYGAYSRYYYPRNYGGRYSPRGYGYGVRPYSNFYAPGFYW